MSDDFAQRYPHIARFVFDQGWIEIGFDDSSDSFVRAVDAGGLVWEVKEFCPSLDDAFAALEQGLTQVLN
ncbi:MAG: hypothetical protein IPK19_07150 [Chloroflexi bacterium]|nr:hypothetical protein [Chloroflexota bacterium]